jgi:hypothetical protein
MAAPDFLAPELSTRFKLVNALPAAVVILIIGCLVLGGAPQDPPDLETLKARVEHLSWVGAVIAVVVLGVSALLLEPLELSSIRLLEGYWSTQRPLAGLAKVGTWCQNRRHSRLLFMSEKLRLSSALHDLDSWPQHGALLPTELGNHMRAFEEQAGAAYDLNFIQLWPRLYYVLPESALVTINGQRNQLDVACRLCLSMGLAALVAAGLLISHGWWLLVPGVLSTCSWLAYRAAIRAADNYGITVSAAVDVYRVRLLQTMRLRMPEDIDEERAFNCELGLLWRGQDTANLEYAPADNDLAVLVQERRSDGTDHDTRKKA